MVDRLRERPPGARTAAGLPERFGNGSRRVIIGGSQADCSAPVRPLRPRSSTPAEHAVGGIRAGRRRGVVENGCRRLRLADGSDLGGPTVPVRALAFSILAAQLPSRH